MNKKTAGSLAGAGAAITGGTAATVLSNGEPEEDIAPEQITTTPTEITTSIPSNVEIDSNWLSSNSNSNKEKYFGKGEYVAFSEANFSTTSSTSSLESAATNSQYFGDLNICMEINLI